MELFYLHILLYKMKCLYVPFLTSVFFTLFKVAVVRVSFALIFCMGTGTTCSVNPCSRIEEMGIVNCIKSCFRDGF